MDLARRYQDGHVCFGDEAAIEGRVLVRDVREIEIVLFLFDHKHLLIIIIDFYQEVGGVEFVHD